MRKLVYIMAILTIFACSKDSDEANEPEEMQYTVTVTNDCERTENTIYTTYCVTEAEHKSAVEQWNNFPPGPSIGCEYTVEFTDIEGNEIEGYFKSGIGMPGACSNME